MTLHLQATLARRGFEVELELGTGQRLAVLGPNGAGKSTLLGVLAGILRPDAGRAVLGDRVLHDVPGRWTPPYARGVALLAQDALLFPHLTVLDNVAFGPRSAGRTRRESREVAERWLAEVEASEFAGRRPAQLSGGQAQRVAVARALATEPELLLLDEPMAALDVGAAPALRRVLRRVLAGRTAVIVSHDLLDAALLADRVLVLDDGHVVETGPTATVLGRPRSPFTARLAGLNLLPGTAETAGLRRGSGELVAGVGEVLPGDPAVAAFGPAAVSVFTEPPHGSPRNVIGVTVTDLEPRGELVRVRAEDRTGHGLAADVTAGAVAELALEPGAAAWFVVKAAAVALYPA